MSISSMFPKARGEGNGGTGEQYNNRIIGNVAVCMRPFLCDKSITHEHRNTWMNGHNSKYIGAQGT